MYNYYFVIFIISIALGYFIPRLPIIAENSKTNSKNSKPNKKIMSYFLIIFFAILDLLLYRFVEKKIQFKSIEECIKYSYPYGKIVDSFESETSAFVIFCDSDNCYTVDIKKSNGKYDSLPRSFKPNPDLYTYTLNNCSIEIIKSEYSSIAKVEVTCINENNNISDSINSNYKDMIHNSKGFIVPGFTQKYCFLKEIPNNFSITVNDDTIQINR